MLIKYLLSPPSHIDMAKKELATAKREWLISQSQLEYAQAMVEFNTKRIARLEKLVKEDK